MRPQNSGVRKLFRAWLSLAVILIFVLHSGTCVSARQFPKPVGYVNDFANVIDSGKKQEIEDLLKTIEKKTTSEIAIVTVSKCAPMDSFTYRTELFKEWGIGKKGKDNGLLLLLCLEERRIEIEVGYGLEATITDGVAGEVLDKYMKPDFKEGKFGDGFLNGAQAIASKILGSNEVAMPSLPSPSPSSSGQAAPLETAIGFVIIFGGIGLFVWIVFLIAGLFKPRCPKCNLKKFVKRKHVEVISHATHYSSGLQDVTYYCKQCDYEWTRREVIPQITESSSSGGWSSGGGFGGFGGGSSGGGGAGRSF